MFKKKNKMMKMKKITLVVYKKVTKVNLVELNKEVKNPVMMTMMIMETKVIKEKTKVVIVELLKKLILKIVMISNMYLMILNKPLPLKENV